MLQKYESTKCILTQVKMESQFMCFGGNSKINWQFKTQVNSIMLQLTVLRSYSVQIHHSVQFQFGGNVRQHGVRWNQLLPCATVSFDFMEICF